MGTYTVQMSDLFSDTTYYVRAYAINHMGIVYGDEVSFTTQRSCPIGAINGLFTINSIGGQVYFSQGNLQYIGSASIPYWKFADHQWDYLGTTTGQDSSDQNVDRDLFGWGTSGYEHGAVCYQPWSTSGGWLDYWAYGSPEYNLFELTGVADWGYNAISNGGNTINQWRTLKNEEWTYIFNYRGTESGIRYAKATVNGICGVVIFPDNWNASEYSPNYVNQDEVHYDSNILSNTQWDNMEKHGAVFLPAGGYREITTFSFLYSVGYYWSSSCKNDANAYTVLFDNNNFSAGYTGGRRAGHSVRLVQDHQRQ